MHTFHWKLYVDQATFFHVFARIFATIIFCQHLMPNIIKQINMHGFYIMCAWMKLNQIIYWCDKNSQYCCHNSINCNAWLHTKNGETSYKDCSRRFNKKIKIGIRFDPILHTLGVWTYIHTFKKNLCLYFDAINNMLMYKLWQNMQYIGMI